MMAPGFAGAMAAAARRGEVAATDRAERLAAAARRAAPAASVVRDGDAVTITGRGVLDSPELRWTGGLLR